MSKMSVFKKNKIVEFTIMQSALVALIFSIGSFGEINFFYILPLCILLSATIQLAYYAFYRVFYGKEYLEEITSQEDMFFAGSIEELTSNFYSSGLKLQSKAGEFYIFTPNYSLFPKHDILVIKSNGGYLVQSNHMVIKFLREVISFDNSPCESEIDNKKTSNKRKHNRYSSDPMMIGCINTNKERR